MTSTAGGFDSHEIAPGKSWKYTATKKGEFAYVCTPSSDDEGDAQGRVATAAFPSYLRPSFSARVWPAPVRAGLRARYGLPSVASAPSTVARHERTHQPIPAPARTARRSVSRRCKNRVLMGSMHTGLEEAPDGFNKLAAFYAARARGGVGLIVTGGIAPNFAGRARAASLATIVSVAGRPSTASSPMPCTPAAARSRCRSCTPAAMRITRCPSRLRRSSRRSRRFARARSPAGACGRTIAAYARCAKLAQRAGYDGVEIMGSEGYLINQFIAPQTNHRDDEWGGSFVNRIRFPVAIVRRTREAVGPDFIIIYRLSMLDLVEGGSTWDEVVALAQAIEAAGATIINTGIGWHEARIPTIATMVPRAAFAWVTRRMKGDVKIPLITTNRINDPATAETLLARGDADMVSMARPFLADPEFVNKAAQDRADEINTCIGCNQACLDQIFERETATCLVNPFACRETELKMTPAPRRRKVAVVGAGPAGHGVRGDGGRARPRRDAVRCGRRDRRAVQPRAAHSRQGGVRRDACAISARGSSSSASEWS